MKKRIISILLAATMLLSLVPMTVFAVTVAFDTEYSMKNAAGEPNAIKWKLTKQKSTEFTLEIYGTGAIPEMTPSSYPWYSTASATNTDSRLKHLIIGENITNLPDFYGESSLTAKFAVLTDIVINSKHFDADLDSAMRGHERITTVTFSEGVESIAFTASNTFASCTGIATLNLPASLKSFNYHSQTFANDTAFKTITLGEGNENFSLVDNVLYNKDKTELILAPTGLTVTPVSTVQRIAAGQNIDAKTMFSAQALDENIQITLKHNKDGKTPDDNVFYVGEMIKADVTAKEGGLPDGLFYAWLGMNGNGTAIDNTNTSKIAGFETPDTFLDGSEFLMSPDALYGAVKITYFPAGDKYTYVGTANCRFAVCKVIEDKITVIAYKDFIAKADSSAYSYDKAIKYIVNDLTAIMVKGETRTVQELLGRSGVTHITCYTVSISNVINKNSSDKISVSNNSITAVDAGEEIPVGFDIAIGNGGVCLYHNHTGSDIQKSTKITNNTFKIRVIDEPQFEVTDSQIIVTNPISDCDYYIGQTKGVLKDGKVYFDNLNSDTEYAVTLQIADQSGAIYTYATNARTAVPTFYAITNGTPEIAKETNHGYIAIDKATAAEGETVTVTVNPAEGYQLKSLTAVPEAPTISTVVDVLATIEGGFPFSDVQTEPSDNAWVADVKGGKKCYAYTSKSGSTLALLLRIPAVGEIKGDFTYLAGTKEVTPGENCYTASHSFGPLTFNMTDGVLTSFTLTHEEGKIYDTFDGTYTPASTPSPRLKPITPEKQTDGTYQFTMPGYAVTVTATFEEKAPAHTHDFTYTANDNKLTATCTAGCDKGYDTTPLTLTLTAPASLVYDGNAKAFTFADGEADAWTCAGLELPTIIYQIKQSGQSTYLPLFGTLKDVGNYMAQITVGEKTAQVYFSIEAPHTHNPVKVTGQAASETAAGWSDYYECKDSTDACHKYFEDATAKVEITDLAKWKAQGGKGYIAPLVHSITPVNGKNATDAEAGYTPYYECKNCGKYYEDATGLIEIPNIDGWKAEGGAGYLAPLHGTDNDHDHICDYCDRQVSECVDADKDHKCDICGGQISQCKDENNDHKCDICGGQISECKDEDNDHKCDICNGQVSEHKGVLVEGTAATLESAGFKSYYKCDCGKFFEDATCKVEITDLAKWKAQGGAGYIAKLEEESEPVPTGDDSNVFIWIILLAVSAVGLCICFVFGKKK